MQSRRREVLAKMDRAIEEDQALFTDNYIPPIKRVGAFGSFSLTVDALGSCLSGLTVRPKEEALQRSLTETLILNPNADLDDAGRFVVRQEHKGLLLESLVKSVIGNTPGLSPQDFDRVATPLSNGRLFADGVAFPVSGILQPIIHVPGREIGDREESYWAADRADIPDMAPDRRFVWQAEHNIISGVLDRYAIHAGRSGNLEVGAGWGDFYWLAPPGFNKRMVSVEWNPIYIAEFRRRFPRADVRQGNIYQLDFPDDSFSNVVGLTPFSSLEYLDHAVAELWRVLKPGGRFFSFQDLIPNDDQVADRLLKRGLVPDPEHVMFFRSEQDRQEVVEALTHVYDFGDRAWREYKKILHRNAVVQNLYEYHEQWLATELKYRGFRILHQEDETEIYIGPREERHQQFCGRCSMDHNRDVAMFSTGSPRGPFREPHPSNISLPYRLLGDDIVERAIVWTTVAEKPQ